MWVNAIRRENWSPTKTSRICGEHFKKTDYVIKPGCNMKILKPDSVPSIFAYPNYLLKKNNTARRVLERVNVRMSIFILNQ